MGVTQGCCIHKLKAGNKPVLPLLSMPGVSNASMKPNWVLLLMKDARPCGRVAGKAQAGNSKENPGHADRHPRPVQRQRRPSLHKAEKAHHERSRSQEKLPSWTPRLLRSDIFCTALLEPLANNKKLYRYVQAPGDFQQQPAG